MANCHSNPRIIPHMEGLLCNPFISKIISLAEILSLFFAETKNPFLLRLKTLLTAKSAASRGLPLFNLML